LSGDKIEGGLQAALKDGRLLCKIMNMIKAGSVKKINAEKTPFKERENIVNYLSACKALRMNQTDLFVTQDLYEGDNMVLVVNNILALGGLARRIEGYTGPALGVTRMLLPDTPVDLDTRIDTIIRGADEFVQQRTVMKPHDASALLSTSSGSKGSVGTSSSEIALFCAACGTSRAMDGAEYARFCGGCGEAFKE